VRDTPSLRWAALALLVAIWGTTWAAIRVGLEGIPPLTGVALRFAIAAALLFGLSPLLGVRYRLGRREAGLWVVNGLLSFCVSYGVVYWAEQWVPSGLSAVLFATYPLFVALLVHFAIPGEALTAAKLGGAVAGFSGVAVIFSEDFAKLGGEGVVVAATVLLLSPIASALASVAVKRWGRSVHPVSLTAVPMALCAVVMGSLAAVYERDLPVRFDARSVAALLYLAIAGSAVTFTVYYWLMARMPLSRLALIAYLIPVVAVAVGAAAFDEPLTLRLLVGSALVIGGVAVAGQLGSRPREGPAV
jgi:drug/metabolite transporter (DMT)-like permease